MILPLMMMVCSVAAYGRSAAGEVAKGVEQAQDSIRVLFIGNSFTYYNKMPRMFRRIAEENRLPVAVASITKGGERLKGHLQNQRLLDTLRRGGWDYVVIQEQSTDPAMSTEFVAEKVYPYAHRLDSVVKAGSPGARTIYYMTWGHKDGFREKTPEYPTINTYDGMQRRLVTSYIEMAYQNGGLCAPVGLAWQSVRSERPDINLYAKDNYHPSKEGSYLAANTIFATIFSGRTAVAYDAGLPADTAAYLRQKAASTCSFFADILSVGNE